MCMEQPPTIRSGLLGTDGSALVVTLEEGAVSVSGVHHTLVLDDVAVARAWAS